MQIKIIISNANKIIHQFAEALSVKMLDNTGELILTFPEHAGEGHLKGMDFSNDLSLISFEGILKSDLELTFADKRNQSLLMVFCMEGNVEFYKEETDEHLRFQPLQSIISVISPGNLYRLKIPRGIKSNCYFIIVGKKEYLQLLGNSTDKLVLLLRDIVENTDRPFHYDYRYSIPAMDIFQEIEKNQFSGVLKKIFIEGKVLAVVSYQLKQYIDEMDPFSNLDMLRKKDIRQLIEAKEILLKDLQNPPVIKELARLIGTNENKLKRGFKQIFGKTITNFIIDNRMEQARILLAEDQWSIKEISERTGYQSSSAFTKVFKKKFGITPKQFIKRYDSQ